ncbi:MAG: phosphatidate cytidylyltransferase, partial [Alistipes sp.]|nr:phosphatidate cytidylyltransferase [Alistipes sp.]
MTRTLSGAVLAVAIVGSLLWSPWSFGAVLALLVAGGMYEFYALAEKRGSRPQRVLGIAVALALFGLNAVVTRGVAGIGFESALLASLALLLLMVPVLLVCELYRKNDDPMAAVGTTLLGILYVVLPMICLFHIASAGGKGWDWNPRAALGYILIIWANDVFAYLVGRKLGRHKHFSRHSSNKSWEGFFGGVAGAVAVGLAAAWWFGGSLWAWGGLALVAAATGVLGDRTESMFKR